MNSVLFLISGGGGSLRFIHNLWKKNILSEISEINIIFDRECEVIEWCKNKGLKYKVIEVNKNNQKELLKETLSFNPSLIITNIFKILNDEYVKEFQGRCINAHWSLLPSFPYLPGKKSVNAALEYQEKIIGSTIHFVTNETDLGPPISQIAFGTDSKKDLDYHTDLMFKASAISLYTSIKKILNSKNKLRKSKVINLEGIDMILNPYFDFPEIFNSKKFWYEIKYFK